MTTIFATHAFWVHVGATGVPVAGGSNPLVGTWILDLAKSRRGGGNMPRSQTMNVEAVGTGIRTTADVVGSTGTPGRNEYTAQSDSRDYPAKATWFDSIVLKRIDPRTDERTLKKNGEVVGSAVRSVSADGKTLSEAWNWYATFVAEKQ